MPAASPTLGYPSKTAAVTALRRKGYTVSQVAEMTGVSVNNVSALEISGARSKRMPRPAEMNGRTVLFPADLLDRLGRHAVRRSISANELARRIVEAAIDDNMVDAILDDAEDCL